MRQQINRIINNAAMTVVVVSRQFQRFKTSRGQGEQQMSRIQSNAKEYSAFPRVVDVFPPNSERRESIIEVTRHGFADVPRE